MVNQTAALVSFALLHALSFVSCIVLVGIHMTVKRKSLILSMGLINGLMSLSVLVGLAAFRGNHWQASTQSCWFQATVLTYCYLADFFLNASQALHMYLLVVHSHRYRPTVRHCATYLFVSFSAPILLLILMIATAKKWTGVQPQLYYCAFMEPKWVPTVFFVGTGLVCMCITIFCTGSIIAVVMKQRRETINTFRGSSISSTSVFRLFLYVILYTGVSVAAIADQIAKAARYWNFDFDSHEVGVREFASAVVGLSLLAVFGLSDDFLGYLLDDKHVERPGTGFSQRSTKTAKVRMAIDAFTWPFVAWSSSAPKDEFHELDSKRNTIASFKSAPLDPFTDDIADDEELEIYGAYSDSVRNTVQLSPDDAVSTSAASSAVNGSLSHLSWRRTKNPDFIPISYSANAARSSAGSRDAKGRRISSVLFASDQSDRLASSHESDSPFHDSHSSFHDAERLDASATLAPSMFGGSNQSHSRGSSMLTAESIPISDETRSEADTFGANSEQYSEQSSELSRSDSNASTVRNGASSESSNMRWSAASHDLRDLFLLTGGDLHTLQETDEAK